MTQLKKDLSLFGLTMIAVGSMIGSGIFGTPGHIAVDLKSTELILLIWVVGGMYALSGSLTYGELATMFPKSGGVYVFLKEAYGDVFGYLFGWATLIVTNSSSIAALSVLFASFFTALIAPATGIDFAQPLLEISTINLKITGLTLTGISVIVVLTLFNIFQVKVSEWFTNIVTTLKVLGILLIISLGFILGSADNIEFGMDRLLESDNTVFGALGLALVGVLWSYGGWQHSSFVAGEARNPSKTLPRAMILASISVTVIYVLANLGYMMMLPFDQMVSSETAVESDRIAKVAMTAVWPEWGGLVISIIIMTSVFGTAGIYIMSCPRIYYAMASDGLFFKGIAKVSKRSRTPVNAILLQASWAIVLLVMLETFKSLITYSVFMDLIFLGLAASSIYVFRRRRPKAERPYKTLGYPVTPAIYIIIVLVLLYSVISEQGLLASYGFISLAAGLPIYFYFKWRSKKAQKPNKNQQEEQ